VTAREDLNAAAERLRRTLGDRLIAPDSIGYDDARRLHNGLIDVRPALIARCVSASDVVDALAFAGEARLDIAIRSGGHSIAGLSSIEGGLVIDLSPMKSVRVDPVGRSGRVEAGVTWGEFDRKAAVFGLAVTGGTISTTGVAGLTLGGGFGWLMGSCGLTVDSLRSADLVTMAGELVTASDDENSDLFWALRGGGGNFGIVTSLEYELHPVATVTGGLVIHPFQHATEVLKRIREVAAEAPDELGLVGALVHAPDGSGTPLAACGVCHSGHRADAERDLRPLLDFGSPIAVDVRPMPYPDINQMLDASYPKGALNYWKSSFVRDLSDDVVDALVDAFADAPSPMTLVAIECFHGAATRVGVTETAVPHREPGFNVLITSVWTDPEETDRNVEWTRRVYDDLRPFLADRRYGNYFSLDDVDAARVAFGPNYEQLSKVKARYDPENVLRRNVNVTPAPP
jgi:FAD/FMN-containing dehydrogenase